MSAVPPAAIAEVWMRSVPRDQVPRSADTNGGRSKRLQATPACEVAHHHRRGALFGTLARWSSTAESHRRPRSPERRSARPPCESAPAARRLLHASTGVGVDLQPYGDLNDTGLPPHHSVLQD